MAINGAMCSRMFLMTLYMVLNGAYNGKICGFACRIVKWQ